MLTLIALSLAQESPEPEGVQRYHEELVGRRSAYVTRIEGFTETMYLAGVDQPASLARARADLLEQTDSARQLPPWEEDASLKEALVLLGESLVSTLDGPFLELLPLLDPPSPFGARRRAQKLRDLSERMGLELGASLDRFDAEALAFSERWGLSAP